MKNLLSLINFMFLISAFGNSQQIVDEGKEWHMLSLPSFSPTYVNYAVRFEGDVEFNNEVYKKVLVAYDSLASVWEETPQLIREDTLNQVVYIGSMNTPERVLYDFSLEVGDTALYEPNVGCAVIVSVIDSITLSNGAVRKRWKFAPEVNAVNFEDIWIEGIGSIDGVLTPFSSSCINDFPTTLLCYFDTDDLQYPEDPETCFFITATNELSQQDKIKAFPNPARDNLFIENLSHKHVLQNLSIIDARGNIVISQLLENEQSKVDVSGLSNGIYYLLIQTEGGDLLSSKFLKIE